MMFCPECGSKNDDNALFCENCGTKLQSGAGNVVSSPVKKEREPLSKENKVLAIEAAVMVVCLILCFVIYGKTCGPESVAEKYVEAKYTQNWSKVYDVLEVKKSGEFSSKEAFVTAQELNTDAEEQVVEIRSSDERSGSFGRKTIIVRYRDNNSAEKEEVVVKKHGLGWKVVTDEYVNKKFAIAVPKGAQVTVDKIDVSGSMKASDEIEEMDTYKFDKVFGARHYVEISGKDIEKTQALVAASEDGPVIVDAGYNEKIMDRLAEQASGDLQKILEAAAANKRFSEVKVFKSIHKNYKEDAISEYEYLRKQLCGSSGSTYELEEYQISNMEAESREVEEGSDKFLEIKVKGEAYLHGTDAYWDGDRYDKVHNGNCSYYLYYGRKDGKWKLSAIDISSIY